jgi:hypothetical protein
MKKRNAASRRTAGQSRQIDCLQSASWYAVEPLESRLLLSGLGPATLDPVIDSQAAGTTAPVAAGRERDSGELLWTANTPFPTVNGHTVPVPQAQPLSTPVGNLGSAMDASMANPLVNSVHWWAGSIYPGSSHQASVITTTIQIPNNPNPSTDEFYYVLVSAWDSNSSYDQLGFTNDYGNWGLCYSWTSGGSANPVYHFNPDAMNLTAGATYTFQMTTQSGSTEFVAEKGTNQVWSLNATTGGNYLNVDTNYADYAGYTDYEEAYYLDGVAPAFNFDFSSNSWTSSGVATPTAWSAFYSGSPSSVSTLINGDGVVVHNQNLLATSTAVASSSILSILGQSVTFTATITPTSGSGETGAVQFVIDGNNAGNPVPLSGNTAGYTTSTLSAGNHSIVAVYSGDSDFAGSTSPALSQAVLPLIPDPVFQYAITGSPGAQTLDILSGMVTLTGDLSVELSNYSLKIETGATVILASDQHMGALELVGNGSLDVRNDTMFINYGSNPDPISTIAGYIKSGYNAGAWNGTGVLSSSAQAPTNGLHYGLGYADGADTVAPGAASGQIEVMYTLVGDANLDGFVNGVDFTILASNFNQSVTSWDRGDFNYDGSVNGEDFTLLAANFNQGANIAAAADVAPAAAPVVVSATPTVVTVTSKSTTAAPTAMNSKPIIASKAVISVASSNKPKASIVAPYAACVVAVPTSGTTAAPQNAKKDAEFLAGR